MKIADLKLFHERWEALQKEIGGILPLAHTDSWVQVDSLYALQIAKVETALKNLKLKELVKGEKVDPTTLPYMPEYLKEVENNP